MSDMTPQTPLPEPPSIFRDASVTSHEIEDLRQMVGWDRSEGIYERVLEHHFAYYIARDTAGGAGRVCICVERWDLRCIRSRFHGTSPVPTRAVGYPTRASSGHGCEERRHTDTNAYSAGPCATLSGSRCRSLSFAR